VWDGVQLVLVLDQPGGSRRKNCTKTNLDPKKKANNSIGRMCPVTRGRRKKEGRGDSLSVVVVVQNFDKRLEQGKEGAGSKKAFDAAPAIQQG
jgi:ribosomal protein S5